MNETMTLNELRVRTLQAVLLRQRALASGLARRAKNIREATAGQRGAWPCVQDLVDFLAGQVLPYASAEEDTIYAAARSCHQLRDPVIGMVNEHEHLASMSSRLASATRLVAATQQAEALAAAFASLASAKGWSSSGSRGSALAAALPWWPTPRSRRCATDWRPGTGT